MYLFCSMSPRSLCGTSYGSRLRGIRFLRVALFVAFALVPLAMQGQNEDVRRSADGVWQRYYDMLADDEDVENGTAENVYDMLADLAANPINLNRVTRDDLERLVFLSDRQREDIAEYVDRYGPVRTVGELAMLPSLDAVRCRLLQCCMYAGEGRARRLSARRRQGLSRTEIQALGTLPCGLRAVA